MVEQREVVEHPSWLKAFADESNKIEGMPNARMRELDALASFCALSIVTVADLETYVKLVAPGHRLRRKAGLNVRVGNHIAPAGGPDIETRLVALLSDEALSPYAAHVAYELLHPFTDGNGRSGRALWLWMHMQSDTAYSAFELGFLHTFYYETLSNARLPSPLPQHLQAIERGSQPLSPTATGGEG